MKKSKKVFILFLVLILIVIATVFGMSKSFANKQLESDVLPDKTIINGIDVSSMNKDDARKKLVNEWNRYYFEIKQDGSSLDAIPLTGVKYTIKDSVNSAVSEAGFIAYIKHMFGTPFDLTIPMTVRKGGTEFSQEFNDFCDKLDEGTIHTEDAYVDLSTTDFTVVEEIYGDNVDRKLLRQAIFDLVAEGTMELDYVKEDFIEVPVITADGKEIKDQLDYCHKYLSEVITYTFGKEEVTITPDVLNTMIYLDDSNKVAVHKKVVEKFIADLAYKYDTYGGTRTFKTTKQGKKKIYGGAYGYIIDQKKEKKQLIKDLKAGKNVTREPIYYYEGNGRNGRDDIGKTYVEVDLSYQHAWYYKDGKCIWDSPFVSGCTKQGTGTITGTYSLAYKERNATLRGQNVDGSDYESEVAYWMPFCNGYGLHDAPWRSSFGGSIYINGGSHGCINLPPANAASLFSVIQTNDVIVIFY